MTFENNPEYTIACIAVNGTKLYMPVNTSDGYHLKRFVAAQAQDIYSRSGTTKELLVVMLNKMLDIVNDPKADTRRIRTDIGTLCNNLLYRTRYPVDEDACIRMGAIYTFLDGEDPNDVNDLWTRKKVELAREDSIVYDFFIELGIRSTPSYREQLNILDDSEYFQNRRQALQGLM